LARWFGGVQNYQVATTYRCTGLNKLNNSVAWGADPTAPPEFVALPAILMGDGVFMSFETLRIAESGVDFVFLHELGHHVQFALNLPEMNDGGSPKRPDTLNLWRTLCQPTWPIILASLPFKLNAF
jgi:hypothetical protein